mmetsp:Transcript_7949/g.32837  ORF Transcript_7949/g.32837 Transcript_7949/m.32837 type:complete len:105 (-) Transcript_7949:313-627(-)
MFAGAARHSLYARSAVHRAAPRVFVAARRPMATYDAFYQRFLKSNVSYVTFVVTGAIFFELIYGQATEKLWDVMNEGKLTHQVDWSKFRDEEDEEEEEEDEDED